MLHGKLRRPSADCGLCASTLFSGNLRSFVIHFLLYLPLVLVLQYSTGVYHSELSHQPDESAHVVTSLMIRDYAATGLGTSPIHFAESYYIHYPKVAIGIWPPMFHTTAALWMLLFTRTHTSLLVFVAVQGALCAAILAIFARRFLPPLVASAAGLFVILLPAMQNAASLMMVDLFLTVMELLALLSLIAMFRHRTMKTAVWCGICVSLAMLTKANATALPLCGVFMLLLTREFSILRKAPVYVASLIVIVLGFPWQFISIHLFQGTVPMVPLTAARFWMLSSGYTHIFVQKLSLPVFLAALVGLAVVLSPLLKGDRQRPVSLDGAGAASLLLAIFLFHSISPTPGPDDRYILPALPLLVLFAFLGIQWIASVIRIPRLSLPVRASILAVFCLGWFAKSTFAITHRPEMGFDKVASQMIPPRVHDEVVLVCSDSWGEGAFITSLALNDLRRKEHIILRGSKMLSENQWATTSYHPLFSTPRELEDNLENTPVDAIVVDLDKAMWEQDRAILMRAIQDNPSKWSLASEIRAEDGRHLCLYRWSGPDHSMLRKNVRVRMQITLGRDLRLP